MAELNVKIEKAMNTAETALATNAETSPRQWKKPNPRGGLNQSAIVIKRYIPDSSPGEPEATPEMVPGEATEEPSPLTASPDRETPPDQHENVSPVPNEVNS